MKDKANTGRQSFEDGGAFKLPIIKIRIEEPFNTVKAIDITNMEEEEKLPQENIVIRRLGYEKKGFNPPLIECTARRGNETNDSIYLNVNGNYRCCSGAKAVLYIMVYNTENDLIGYSSDISVCKDSHFIGNPPFSESVEVPKNEEISKIVLMFGPDPL